MPSGKGTYGAKRGRPPTTKAKKKKPKMKKMKKPMMRGY